MSELTLGNTHGLVSSADFPGRLRRVIEAAENGQTASFYAQKRDDSHLLHISNVAFLSVEQTRHERKEITALDNSGDNVGLYLTGKPYLSDLPLKATITPTAEDLEEFRELHSESLHVIGGIATPRLLGGAALLLFRESTAQQVSQSPAINKVLLEYPGSSVGIPRVIGDVSNLFL